MTFPDDLISENVEIKSQNSITGKILLGLTGGVALSLSVVCASFVSPAFRKFCLPFIPATRNQIDNIILALKDRQGTVLDLGSGDGRIVLEAARCGFIAHGVELNFWLVAYSKINAFRKGLHKKTDFFCRDLWKFRVGDYDNVVIFGVEQMMADLEKKLHQECKFGSNIIACRFPLPNTKPMKTFGHGIDTVWIYDLNNSK